MQITVLVGYAASRKSALERTDGAMTVIVEEKGSPARCDVAITSIGNQIIITRGHFVPTSPEMGGIQCELIQDHTAASLPGVSDFDKICGLIQGICASAQTTKAQQIIPIRM